MSKNVKRVGGLLDDETKIYHTPLHVLKSGENPRKSMDAEGLKGLTESVKQLGILSPLLAFKKPGNSPIIIISGHRRLAAAEKAGLKEVPVILVEAEDQTAAEAAIVENIQREELPPMDEAQAMQALAKNHKMTPADLAVKFGKSEIYVVRRMKLMELPPQGQAAVRAEEMSLGVAVMILRIQDPRSRNHACVEILRMDDGTDPWAAAQIISKFMTELSSAPWKLDDAELHKKAGPCSTCPKRSSRQQMLFDVAEKKDRCLDVACFAKKKDLWGQAELKSLKQGGAKILKSCPKGTVKRWDGELYLPASTGLVLLSAAVPNDSKSRRWMDVLGKLDPRDVTVFLNKGRLERAMDSKTAHQIIKKKGIKRSPGKVATDPKEAARNRTARLKQKAESLSELVAVTDISKAILWKKLPRRKWEKMLTILLPLCLKHEGTKRILTLIPDLKDKAKKTSWGGKDYEPALMEMLQKAEGPVFMALVMKILLAEFGMGDFHGEDTMTKVCKVAGFNFPKIKDGILKELQKPKPKPKAKPKKKAKAKK